jgi:hypothetical protein
MELITPVAVLLSEGCANPSSLVCDTNYMNERMRLSSGKIEEYEKNKGRNKGF